VIVAALYVDRLGVYPQMARAVAATIARNCPPDDDDWNASTAANFRDAFHVDCWDESRDARLYDGPHPVVAHPPCRHWGQLAHMAHVGCSACDWTGPAAYHNGHHVNGEGDEQCEGDQASDRDCAIRAVEQVRRFGGVLEHPAGSRLFTPKDGDAREFDEYPPLPDFEPAAGSPMAACGVRRISTVRNEMGAFVDSFGGYTIEVAQVEWGHVARKRTWLYLVGVPREALEAPPFPGREPTHWISGGRGRAGKKAKTTPVPPGIKVASACQRRRTPPLFAEYLVRLARSARCS
jgi:hypothetical protein